MVSQTSIPGKIIAIREALSLSQSELGRKLGCSAMAVSRWERGGKCPANLLIRLGTLASSRDCWFFWNMAGLTSQDVIRVLPVAKKTFGTSLPVLRLVAAGAKNTKVGNHGLVAIPLFPLVAAADGKVGSSDCDLDSTAPDSLLAAPTKWCPNPEATVCLKVKGDSMEPVLQDGYIIVVDRKQNKLGELDPQIVVAHHDEFGLAVSRLCKFEKRYMLVPDNRRHEAIPVSSKWRIVGAVLWWIGSPMMHSKAVVSVAERVLPPITAVT